MEFNLPNELAGDGMVGISSLQSSYQANDKLTHATTKTPG
jgi:hypothetical protein